MIPTPLAHHAALLQAENAIRPVDGQVDVVDGDHHQQVPERPAPEQPQQRQLGWCRSSPASGFVQQQELPGRVGGRASCSRVRAIEAPAAARSPTDGLKSRR